MADPPNRLLGHFNHVKPPFNNCEARKALVMAYDNDLSFGELQYDAWFNKYQDVEGKERALLARLARETDVAKQKQVMDEFQTYFYDDAIFLQVGEFFSRWAARSDLKGVVAASASAQLPANKWIEKK